MEHTHPTTLASPPEQHISDADLQSRWNRVVGRRSFLAGIGSAGAAAMLFGPASAFADGSDRPSRGDVAILRFLAAAEIIETDLWQQYSELGGVNGGNAAYIAALENLDADMPQYIDDNTDDEMSHAAFLNAYLQRIGADPVNLDAFRTLPSTAATGAKQIGRLTNLQMLNVDTSWYTRYRSDQNPDFGATFPQAVTINNQPAIPVSDAETPPGNPAPVPPANAAEARMQAIANTAGFHFAMIEQGGSSLYTTMALKATSLEVLRIIVSIGGTEVNHFAVWHDKAGNAVSDPLAPLTDPISHITFPDLNTTPGGELFQTNLIFPEPCEFIDPSLPVCSVIRPSLDQNAGAVAAVHALTNDNLFAGQSAGFFTAVMGLAIAADAAMRGAQDDNHNHNHNRRRDNRHGHKD
jgi:Ferritin-like domain